MRFTICVLLYGGDEHAWLHDRCLDSITSLIRDRLVDVRIGCNAIGPKTFNRLAGMVENGYLHRDSVYGWEDYQNIHKYPRMRKMFVRPFETEYVLWLDDDSYVKDAGFLPRRLLELYDRRPDVWMFGSIYAIELIGAQQAWIAAQPWYAGQPTQLNRKKKPAVRFCTGGGWIAKTELFARLDWPWSELDHRGGDVMLGAACYQQGLEIAGENLGLAINADENGRESEAKRRGFDQRPIGADYRPAHANGASMPIQAKLTLQPAAPSRPAGIIDLGF